jgi:hypothetical protein
MEEKRWMSDFGEEDGGLENPPSYIRMFALRRRIGFYSSLFATREPASGQLPIRLPSQRNG